MSEENNKNKIFTFPPEFARLKDDLISAQETIRQIDAQIEQLENRGNPPAPAPLGLEYLISGRIM